MNPIYNEQIDPGPFNPARRHDIFGRHAYAPIATYENMIYVFHKPGSGELNLKGRRITLRQRMNEQRKESLAHGRNKALSGFGE